MRTIALLAGARPNYMKIFPLWREFRDTAPDVRPVVIHTGQHYDELMSEIFFRDLGMPEPDHFLGVGSGPHGAQTGRTMIALEPVLEKERPDLLVVVGDVNSTAAGALVGVKMGIPVAHVEAGLRSRDRTMPEEINRIATDSIADILLTSCRDADENLRGEGIPAERIHFVGNLMIDSLVSLLPHAERSDILKSMDLVSGHFIAVTLHRPSNVDEPGALRAILEALDDMSRRTPVVFPVHPRTRKALAAMRFQPSHGGFRIIEPLGYLDFLRLESQAALVVTDSGGVQEETTYLGIPCLTVRPNTERPITITQGTNRLVASDRAELLKVAEAALANPPRPCPAIEFWDGKAARRTRGVLLRAPGVSV
jgi:UDP-N-acetylglucosamine 2-epimerase (non-hydrolysing)